MVVYCVLSTECAGCRLWHLLCKQQRLPAASARRGQPQRLAPGTPVSAKSDLLCFYLLIRLFLGVSTKSITRKTDTLEMVPSAQEMLADLARYKCCRVRLVMTDGHCQQCWAQDTRVNGHSLCFRAVNASDSFSKSCSVASAPFSWLGS